MEPQDSCINGSCELLASWTVCNCCRQSVPLLWFSDRTSTFRLAGVLLVGICGVYLWCVLSMGLSWIWYNMASPPKVASLRDTHTCTRVLSELNFDAQTMQLFFELRNICGAEWISDRESGELPAIEQRVRNFTSPVQNIYLGFT